jgi:hypothetical protein
MSYQIWQQCFRISSVVFPISTVSLFFAAPGSAHSAALAVTAVASTGLWAYCSGHRPRRLNVSYAEPEAPGEQAEA